MNQTIKLDTRKREGNSGLFDETDIAEVEELAAAYYDALDAAEESTEQEGEM